MTNREYTDLEIEIERQEVVRQWVEADISIENLKRRFLNEIGYHEVLDRTYMMQEMWYQFIVENPAVALNKDLFNQAYKIHQSMMDVYQKAGSLQCEV